MQAQRRKGASSSPSPSDFLSTVQCPEARSHLPGGRNMIGNDNLPWIDRDRCISRAICSHRSGQRQRIPVSPPAPKAAGGNTADASLANFSLKVFTLKEIDYCFQRGYCLAGGRGALPHGSVAQILWWAGVRLSAGGYPATSVTGVPGAVKPAALAGRRSRPAHGGIKPGRQRPTALEGFIVEALSRGAAFVTQRGDPPVFAPGRETCHVRCK